MSAETTPATDLIRAEARLPRWMTAWAILGTLVALFAGRGQVAAGFALGAGLAILNYYWLHQAIEALFNAGHARVPRWLVVKFVVRYPLAFAGVYVFYRTGWLPFQAILAGLFVPVAGVLVEGIFQIREGLRFHNPT